MKVKFTTLVLAVACAMTFVSCDPDDMFEIVSREMFGKIEVVVTNPEGTQKYSDGDTIRFNVSLCNAVSLGNPSTLFFGSKQELFQNDQVVISTPLVGAKLNDTVLTATTHDIVFPLDDLNRILDLDWQDLLVGDSYVNQEIFIIAADSSSFYIGINGTVAISEFGSVGSMTKGEIRNMLCYYITEERLDTLRDLYRRANSQDAEAIAELQTIKENNYRSFFSTMTVNGTINSRRANIAAIVSALHAE